MLDFIGAFAAPLAEISPHFVADCGRTGDRSSGSTGTRGSRGTRRPTRRTRGRISATRRERTRTRPASISIWSPGCVLPGCGVWRPDGPTVTKIRETIDVEQQAWTTCDDGSGLYRDVRAVGGLVEAAGPRGYERTDALAEDLKRKDFIAVTSFSEAEVLRVDFLDWFAGIARRGHRWWSSCRTRWGWTSRDP